MGPPVLLPYKRPFYEIRLNQHEIDVRCCASINQRQIAPHLNKQHHSPLHCQQDDVAAIITNTKRRSRKMSPDGKEQHQRVYKQPMGDTHPY